MSEVKLHSNMGSRSVADILIYCPSCRDGHTRKAWREMGRVCDGCHKHQVQCDCGIDEYEWD